MYTFSCDSIHKAYRTGCLKPTRKQALFDVTFQVEDHEIFGIIGLNGAGKSSILKIFMGFIKPDSGTASIGGKAVTSYDCRRQIGYLPEHPSLYPHLSITEHLQFGCRIGGLSPETTKTRIQTVLENVDLSDVAKMPIRGYSKGMTQRAALAYAILLEPAILILDEPMSGLDPLGRQLIIDIIREYQGRGTTILFCSHILTDVERICDRIGIMHKGKLESIISAESLRDKDSTHHRGQTPLEQLFLDTVGKYDL